MDLESFNILHEICTMNGIQYDNLTTENFHNHILYILFSGFKKWISLQNFPYLTELIIISQDITYIAKLETCPNLKKLWLCECKLIQKIENLNTCKQLTELYLYDNSIKKIENLTFNYKLEYLWLNNNQIQLIENLNHLKLLKQLNLSGNYIEHLNSNLLYNQKLEQLFISGNQLWNFNDLLILNKLPILNKLNINEPEYLKNPLCNNNNNNLPLLLIYYLPQLCQIDYMNINQLNIKLIINEIIKNKKSYYRMKNENAQTLIEKNIFLLKLLFEKLKNKFFLHIQYIDKILRFLENIKDKQLNDTTADNDTTYKNQTLINLINELNKKINNWENIYNQSKLKFNLLCNRLEEYLNYRQFIYELELQMFGYLEIQEIDIKDDLYNDCYQFLESRFCYHDEIGSMINGIKILHLYEINNKVLQQNHNHNKKDVSNVSIKSSTFSDYLFLVCPEKIDELNIYMNIIRNGLQMDNKYKLTNSLNLADDKNLQVMHRSISEGNFNQYDHVARLVLMNVSMPINHNMMNDNNNDKEDETFVENALLYEKQSSCHCLSQVQRPDLFHSKLLYPEFLVEIEYLLKTNESNYIFNQFDIETDIETNGNLQIFDDGIQSDQQFIKITALPLIENYKKLSNLNELSNNNVGLLQKSINFNLNKNNLFLNDLKISKINFHFPEFSNLSILSITHCQLDTIPSIQCNHLITLIINHNQLKSIKSIGYMPQLIELQIDYNQLTCIIDNVSNLLINTPKLEKLSWNNNPWKLEKLIRIYTLAKINSLKFFNFQSIHKEEIELSKQLLDSCIITTNMIQQLHITTTNNIINNNNDFDQNLTIFPIAYYHQYNSYNINQSYIINNSNNINYYSITSLCLQSLNIYKIQNLENLINLKYLSLNHNLIEKIEGLNNNLNLIELSLEYNLIHIIENINHLIKLECLLLSNNNITKINKLQFNNLLNLRIISLRNNKIKKINFIYNCQSLIELYLGNNQLNHFKIILYLKNLKNLNILELTNNPICNLLNHYRYQIIYYIKSIKSLDGIQITSNELIQSNELFNGHLTNEYLINYLNLDNFSNLVELNLSNCMLKTIDYIDPIYLIHLKSINLEKNYLKSFGGLLFFKNLKIICLNENNIESLFSNHIYLLSNNLNNNINHNYKLNSIELNFINLYKSKQPIYPNLNVLHLAYNNVQSLEKLQLHRIPCLQTLFLQNNELYTIHGIEHLTELKELVVDNNKIKYLNEITFLYNWTLNEIHLENNRLNELNQFNQLNNLKRLYIDYNKLIDFIDFENFAKKQKNLYEISLIHNPITSKQIHRLILIYYITNIQLIDGIQVTNDERNRIIQFYEDKQLTDIINCGIISSTSWYNHHTGKMNNPICEITLPDINIKKSLIYGIKMNDHTHTLLTNNSRDHQTVFVYGKQIRPNIDCHINKTRLNMLSKHNLSIQTDCNEKNALTIKGIHHSNHELVGNFLHYQHQYVKQRYQCSTPDIKKLSIHSFTRPYSQTSKVDQLKSLKRNNNNNHNNKSHIKTMTNITINADSNISRNGCNNNLIKFSAMSTSFQR
ncbi:hypothetical protein Smp_124590 [Schistosoma mansoni]|uniref:hypothetical protein n=1 Tax=Schistosoma mansoni TaxID=6183 RepID=UPI00022DC0FE|nr:hypothetical protein Smp_124590 [Schistosoma mansoni]|eukprot:XP_018652407.1 hypothetical protein Smp_124590 [Schistosoma mansoni]